MPQGVCGSRIAGPDAAAMATLAYDGREGRARLDAWRRLTPRGRDKAAGGYAASHPMTGDEGHA